MMDSLCDSDSTMEKPRSSEDSEVDMQLLAEQETAKLQEENASLLKETNILRAQFESAVNLTRKMDEIHAKNMKLAADARSLQSEKADVERRLEISLRTNQEITGQLAAEKKSALHRQTQQQAENEAELSRYKREFEAETEKLKGQLKKSEDDKEHCELRLKQIESKVNHLLQNAKLYFDTSFDGIDSLVELLLKPNTALIEAERANARSVEQAEALKAKVKKQRTLLKDSKKCCEKLASEVKRLQKELDQTTKQHEIQLKKVDARHAEEYEERKIQGDADRRLINELQLKNEALGNQLKSVQAELKTLKDKEQERELQAKTTIVQPVDKPDPIKKLRERISDLSDCLAELKGKLDVSEQKRENLTQSLITAEKKAATLEAELKKRTSELSASQIVHGETLKEIDALRESLHAKNEKEVDQKEIKLSKCLKAKVAHLKHTVKTQSQQIHELSLENENYRANIEKWQNKHDGVKAELNETKQKLEQICSDLTEARLQLQEKHILTPDDVMPVYAWRADCFDSDLAQEIDKLALTSVLQPPSKLHHIYRAIQKHYAQVLSERDRQIKTLSDDLQNVKNIINQLTVDVSLSLSMSAITFDDLMKGGDQRLVEKVKQVVETMEDAQRQKHQFDALAEHITTVFGEAPDMFVQLTDIKQVVDGLSTSVKRKSRKCHALKAKLRELQSATETQLEELQEENRELNSCLVELRKEHEDSTKIVSKLKNDLAFARRDYQELVNSHSEAESGRAAAHEKSIAAVRGECGVVEARLNEHIERLNNELAKAAGVIDEYESNLSKMKKGIQAAQKIIEEKESQITELNDTKDRENKRLQSQYASEKSHLVENYEKALEELRQQCDAHRNDLEKVSFELSESKKLNAEAKKSLLSLKREKARLDNELTKLQDRLERERSLSRAAVKNAQLTADTTVAQKVQETKDKLEAEKRRIFTFAADEFRTFFNAADAIDERSFRTLMNKVSYELKRLSESDARIRQLTGAAPRQATDDAVAQIAMK